MALDCGAKCAKYILFSFNILIWISGAVVLGTGIWFLVDPNALSFIHVASVNMSSELMRGAAIALVTVGTLAFITGFFGCCGACNENACMLQTYAIILSMLLVLQVAAGIAGAVFRGKINDNIAISMNKTVQELYKYNGTDETTLAFDVTQKEFKCCATSGPDDWATSQWRTKSGSEPVPMSCCVLLDVREIQPVNVTLCYQAANDPNMRNRASYLHVEGCQEQLKEWVDDHALILIGVALGLAVVQIFAITFACCLKNRVNSQYQYV